MADAKREASAFIGYFAHVREGNTAWGALVLVTPEGDPVDFLYTDPVTVGRLTHTLLGPRMDGYLVDRVLLAPLVEQAGPRLALVCLDDPALLQRRPGFAVAVAVLAPPDAAHKEGAWAAETMPNGSGGPAHTWWLSGDARAEAMARLRQAAEVLAPFGILEPFQHLRAAMAEVRAERT